MKTRKVVIIGAGHVGSHVALGLIQSGEADDIVLIDILKEKAAAQALDLDDCVSGALCGHDAVIRAGEYEELNDADIMVVAFGRSRKPGETRLDMFDDTIRMANEVIGHLKQVDFKGIMISISNPADIICEYIRRQMNWQTNRCFCTGTSLETYRLLRVLSAVKAELPRYQAALRRAQQQIETAGKTVEGIITTRTNVMERKLKDIDALEDAREADEILGLTSAELLADQKDEN